MEAKWKKRDKKLNRRRDLNSVKRAMNTTEPRKKKRRYKSHADQEWDYYNLTKEGF